MEFSIKVHSIFVTYFFSESFILILKLKFWTNIGVFGGEAPEFREKSKGFKKFLKSMKNLQFSQKFVGKFRKYASVGGSGAEPTKLAKLLKTYSKNQWKPAIFLKISLIRKVFLFKKLIFIIIKVALVGYWKSLIFYKKLTNPAANFFAVGLKTN